MEELLEILQDIDDSVDYENETALIDDHILDSFGIITLISEIEEHFDIEVDAAEMTPENFTEASGELSKWPYIPICTCWYFCLLF